MPKKVQNSSIKEKKPEQKKQSKKENVKPQVVNQTQPVNQPQIINQAPPMTNVTYDSEGRPIFANNPYTPVQPTPTKKIGPFVAGIITLILAIGFIIFSIYFNASAINDLGITIESGDIWAFFGYVFTFLLYLLSGAFFFTVLPALGFSIAAVTCSAISCKSCKKAIKGFSIVFLIFSIIALIASIILPFIILLGFSNP